MRRVVAVTFLLSQFGAWQLGAAELKPRTVIAFERYVQQTEQHLETRPHFLWADESPDRAQRVRQGDVLVAPAGPRAVTDVPDGLVHDWVGCVFLPGVTIDKTLAVIQDYDHMEAYRPEVISSHLLSRDGNDIRFSMRLLKKKVITVVLDTEHEVHYFPVGPEKWRSVSRTTKIAQVEHAGKPDEHVLPPGTGEGFLWRLTSFWRFQERDGGVWVECEAISLTRDIPTGLSWIIKPIIRDLPKESLENTLRHLRESVEKLVRSGQ